MIDQLVGCVIRPPRAEYIPEIDLIGPSFKIKGRKFQRIDLELVNSRGHTLQCSHYVPVEEKDSTLLPCVIYCHGNSGCRADANDAVMLLLPHNITVFALDFSGSGVSGGEYVSLGAFEKDDLTTVVDYLRVEAKTSLIGLWGRSMGAVTSILYASMDPSIAGMVVDSPFSNLHSLMLELCDVMKLKLPKFTLKFAVQYMRRLIRQRAKFDIMDLDTTTVAPQCFIPALFGHAESDNFILPHHSVDIHKSYAGDKNLIKFEGDHNSPRPPFYFDSVSIFFHNVLNPPDPQQNSPETNFSNSFLPDESFAPGFEKDFESDFEFMEELDQETINNLLNISKNEKSISNSSSSSSSNILNSNDQKTQNENLTTQLNSTYQPKSSPLLSLDRDKTQLKNELEIIMKFSQDENQNQNNLSSFFIPPEDYDEEKMLMEAIAASLQLEKKDENVNGVKIEKEIEKEKENEKEKVREMEKETETEKVNDCSKGESSNTKSIQS